MGNCSIDVTWSFSFDNSKVIVITESYELNDGALIGCNLPK